MCLYKETNKRRRFRALERIAMFIYSKGKCSKCNSKLKKGWHSDHKLAFSKGGQTDVINGQALCRECNLKKGNRDNEIN